eukprot:scaffold5532_cov180-Amphora_coffeaeformis.AAC.4
MSEPATISTAPFAGVWHRLLEEAPPLGQGGVQDRSTIVLWTQSECSMYVDLRLPQGHPGRPDMIHQRLPARPSALSANGYSQQAKKALSQDAQLYSALLQQQSFAGVLTVTKDDTTPHQVAVKEDPVLKQLSSSTIASSCPSVLPPLFTCHWERRIDCQPPATRLDIGVCAPQLPPLANGSILLRETGDDASYAEDWLLLGTESGSSSSGSNMAATLVTENGVERPGYWVWTNNRFAYAIGYPTTEEDCKSLNVPVEVAQVKQATAGQTLKELLPKILDGDQSATLDVLGSYVAVAGTVTTHQDGTRDWIIQYSTHAELVGCSLLTEGKDGEDPDSLRSCSWMEHWDATDLQQHVRSENGKSLVRIWKVESHANLPQTPRKIYGMDPHPDYVDVDMPRTVALPSFSLTPLSPEHVQEDYEAVVASIDVLQGTFGNEWPVGLTTDDNLIDLSWHEREFTLQRSFSWIVREPKGQEGGSYLGCVYIFPEQGCRGKAKVVTWIRAEQADRPAILEKLNEEFKGWLDGKLSALEITLDW